METAAPKSETQSPLRKTDFTTDHLFKKMIQFTIPIILISLFQLFFYSMDQLVVSNFGGGQTSFAAISSNNALINLYVSFFVGLSIGANVIVARARGTKNTLSAHRAIQSSMVIALISGVLVAVIGYFTARYQLIAMGTPKEILPQATLYLQLVFCGMPFVIIFNFGAACLRAMGDSKRPLYALIGCGIVNVGLNLLLVLGLGMKSDGKDVLAVGLATIVSQVVEALLIILFQLSKKNEFANLTLSYLKPYSGESKGILRHGIPAGLQYLAFTLSNVLIQRSVNTYSDGEVTRLIAMNGNAAALQVEGYISMIIKAFSVAIVVIAAQNVGAGNKENLKKTLKYCLLTTCSVSLALGLLAFLLYKPLLSLFLPLSAFTGEGISADQAQTSWELALSVGRRRLLIIGLTYFLYALMDNTAAFCRGLGHPNTPSIIAFFCVTFYRVVFILTLWNLVPYPSGRFPGS
jgi:putative MATE family efflux protein